MGLHCTVRVFGNHRRVCCEGREEDLSMREEEGFSDDSSPL